MATIYDIARFCKTSSATVSYVLNGDGDRRRISKATQERVLAAAEMLHYRPNTAAKRLRKEMRKALNIALFWPSYSFEQGLISTLRAAKSTIEMTQDPLEITLQFFEPGRLAEKESILLSQTYNAVLLGGMAEEDMDYLSGHNPPMPAVVINRSPKGFPVSTIDHRAAGRMACDIALKKGENDIYVFWEHQYHVATDLRRSAFMERCEELGVDLSNRQSFCEGSEESGYEQGIRLIQKRRIPRVIFCNHEAIARGVLSALTESSVHVGEQVQLFTTSVAPASYCRYCTPSLTVIDLKMQQVAERALRMSLSLISHQPLPSSIVTLQPEVIFRDSLLDT